MFTELYLTFKNPKRRRLVAALHETRPGGSVALPAYLARRSNEPDAALEEFTSVHLPFLERVGFVDWDADQARVDRGPRFAELEPYLAVAAQINGDPAIGLPS